MAALLRLEQSPELSPEELERARKLALRLMTDITLVKSDRSDEPIPDRSDEPVAA